MTDEEDGSSIGHILFTKGHQTQFERLQRGNKSITMQV